MIKRGELWREFHELLFPTRCLGCGILETALCFECRKEWKILPQGIEISRFMAISGVSYGSVAKRILLASKEDGVHQADDLVVEALRLAYRTSQMSWGQKDYSKLTLVPIPSTPNSIRRRGRDAVLHLTQRVGDFTSHSTQPMLIHNRRVKDHAGLSATARATNISGAFSVGLTRKRPRQILLVDDLVTSGATLREAARTLRSEGFVVLGAITAFQAQPLEWAKIEAKGSGIKAGFS